MSISGHVDAFVEEVDAEDHVHLAVSQVAQRRLTIVGGRIGRDGDGREVRDAKTRAP